MKIRKLGKFLIMLCTFALLCGCAGNVNSLSGNGTEQSTESSTASNSTISSDVSSENSNQLFYNNSSNSKPQPVDIGNGMTLTGMPLDNSEFEEFSVKPDDNDLTESEEEFLGDLEVPEIMDLYKRTLCLTWYSLSPFNIGCTSAVWANNREWPYIDGTLRYYETGYTYESFYNEYLRTFTKETTDKMFKEYDVFLNYNGELFCSDGARGSWLMEVHRELELISKSETVIEFRRLIFHRDSDGKPAMGYVPEYRNEYDIGVTDFKFVLTENGWRTANIPVERESEL